MIVGYGNVYLYIQLVQFARDLVPMYVLHDWVLRSNVCNAIARSYGEGQDVV